MSSDLSAHLKIKSNESRFIIVIRLSKFGVGLSVAT